MEHTDWANCIQTETSGRIWFITCPQCPQGDLRLLSQWQILEKNFDLSSTAEPHTWNRGKNNLWPWITTACACYIYIVSTVSHFFLHVISGALYSTLTVNRAEWWIGECHVLNHPHTVCNLDRGGDSVCGEVALMVSWLHCWSHITQSGSGSCDSPVTMKP